MCVVGVSERDGRILTQAVVMVTSPHHQSFPFSARVFFVSTRQPSQQKLGARNNIYMYTHMSLLLDLSIFLCLLDAIWRRPCLFGTHLSPKVLCCWCVFYIGERIQSLCCAGRPAAIAKVYE
jgi:hypothetical protein